MSNGPPNPSWTQALNAPHTKVGNVPKLIRKPPKAGEYYIDKPPNDVLRDWINNNTRSHISGIIIGGFKTWYGVVHESPNGSLTKMLVKIMWDRAKLPHNIKIYIGDDPSYKEWKYELKLVEVCNISSSAKDGLTKFQFIIIGDVVTLDPLKRTFVLS